MGYKVAHRSIFSSFFPPKGHFQIKKVKKKYFFIKKNSCPVDFTLNSVKFDCGIFNRNESNNMKE